MVGTRAAAGGVVGLGDEPGAGATPGAGVTDVAEPVGGVTGTAARAGGTVGLGLEPGAGATPGAGVTEVAEPVGGVTGACASWTCATAGIAANPSPTMARRIALVRMKIIAPLWFKPCRGSAIHIGNAVPSRRLHRR